MFHINLPMYEKRAFTNKNVCKIKNYFRTLRLMTKIVVTGPLL